MLEKDRRHIEVKSVIIQIQNSWQKDTECLSNVSTLRSFLLHLLSRSFADSAVNTLTWIPPWHKPPWASRKSSPSQWDCTDRSVSSIEVSIFKHILGVWTLVPGEQSVGPVALDQIIYVSQCQSCCRARALWWLKTGNLISEYLIGCNCTKCT